MSSQQAPRRTAMSISDRLDQIEARRAQANSSLNGRHMLVGKDVPEMLAALRAVLDLHEESTDEGMGWRDDNTYGYVGTVCGSCGTPDEYGVPWPCPTVRAVQAALGEES